MEGRRHFNPLDVQGPPQNANIPRSNFRVPINTTHDLSNYHYLRTADPNVYDNGDLYGPMDIYPDMHESNYGEENGATSHEPPGELYGNGSLNENPTYAPPDLEAYSGPHELQDRENRLANSWRPSLLRQDAVDAGNGRNPEERVTRGNECQFLSKNTNYNHEPQIYYDNRNFSQAQGNYVIPAPPQTTQMAQRSFENKEYFRSHQNRSARNVADEQDHSSAPVPAPRRHTVSVTTPPSHLNIRPPSVIDNSSDDENVLGGGVGSPSLEPERPNPGAVHEKIRSKSTSFSHTAHSSPHHNSHIQGRVGPLPPYSGPRGETGPSCNQTLQRRQPFSDFPGTSTALLHQWTRLELDEKPWFNKTIEKTEAEEKLYSRKKVGCYVVRNSRHKDGLNFAISFYYHTVSGTGNVKHLSITFLPDTHKWKVGNDDTRETPTFNSVSALVEHYRQCGFSLDDGTSIELKEILPAKKKSIAVKLFGKQ